MDEEESIFPELDFDEEINDEAEEVEEEESEHGGQVMKIDFETGDIVLEDGRPVLIDGAEAYLQWIEKILRTKRGAYEIVAGSDLTVDLPQQQPTILATLP